jgi:DNA polymerase-1
VFDVDSSEIDLLSLNIKKIMESVIKIQVPLLVDVGYGKTWLEAH